MKARGGQGLPLNVIILAAISVLVLILVIAFATGAFSKLFGGTKTLVETATPDQIAAFRLGCDQACFGAKQLADTEFEWKNSDYCKRTIKINGTNTHCWQPEVASDCSKTATIDGVTKTFGAASGDIVC